MNFDPATIRPAGESFRIFYSAVRRKADAHHAAVPFDETPAFMAELRKRPRSMSAAALEFAVLTACRTGEVLGARWNEIKGNVWKIPALRMKARVEHRVPLCDRAVELLKGLEHHGEFVFISRHGNRMSDTSLLHYLKEIKPDATVHGFRSSFRDWAAERTNFPNIVAEKALAHTIPDKVEKAYRRGDLFEKRRNLMEQWARFLDKPIPAEGGEVADLAQERERLRGLFFHTLFAEVRLRFFAVYYLFRLPT